MPDAEQLVADLQAKLGSDHPFVIGFVYELQKEGAPAWMTKLIGRLKGPAAEVSRSPLQDGLAKMKARLSAAKPQIAAKTPMPHETFPVDRETSHFHARMDAKRARGRTEPAMV